MRGLLFYLLINLFATTCIAQKKVLDDTYTHDFTTVLNGGYRIVFKHHSGEKYLYLAKDKKIISKLSEISDGETNLALGYLGADFKDYFVISHTFGYGNPSPIELFEKSTGKSVLVTDAFWIDAVEEKQYLLYSSEDVPNKNDTMILLNVATGHKQTFKFPSDVFDGVMVLERIKIKAITKDHLVISYSVHDVNKIKSYSLD
jgi:hypothetical protein